ncbi:sulfite reductase subunit alpha [Uliginosibacterium sediminicola]|uniref:NADPH--hemoprotein reductase n=1 Tax=Uliginosibacterium sediminicola TaxID=2024550 RepID=A0ABU9YTG0_9RHOO
MSPLDPDTWRWLCAALIIALHSTLSLYMYRRNQLGNGRASARLSPGEAGGSAPLQHAAKFYVIYASQSGQAEAIARDTAQHLSAHGQPARLLRLEQDWLSLLQPDSRLLFVVSTCGEGDAPDHASRFVRHQLRQAAPALRGIAYSMLALGDRNYAQFCGFGRQLDAWLQASGAQAGFARLEADQLDAATLQTWYAQLAQPSDTPRADSARAPITRTSSMAYGRWQLLSRQCLNDGSAGQPMYLIRLAAEAGSPCSWQAGDLVDIQLAGADARPRSYSIANLPPGDGSPAVLELIVRRQLRSDGTPGLVSGWLCEQAATGSMLSLRIRANPNFQLPAAARTPLILIGAGAGLAGLRAHLQARARSLQHSGERAPTYSAWLIFGERSRAHDRLCHSEIEDWLGSGVLSRMDWAFSRDDASAPYVQHQLRRHAALLQTWLDQGACILMCGSAHSMARALDKTLRELLGEAAVDTLTASGRLRRDVF